MGPGVECWGANPRRLLLVRAQRRWHAFMLVPTEQNMFLSTSFFRCWCPTDIFTGFNVMFLQCHLLSFNYRPLKGQPGFMKAQFHSRESKARGGIEPSTFTSGLGACAPPNQRSISFIEHDSNPGVKLGRHKKNLLFWSVLYVCNLSWRDCKNFNFKPSLTSTVNVEKTSKKDFTKTSILALQWESLDWHL